jgi:hypothetical protein
VNDNQWLLFGVFAFGAVLFLADAIWNWGLFQNRPRDRRSEKYGPIQRVLRIIVGVGMVAMLVQVLVMMLLGAVPGGGSSRATRPAPPRQQTQAPPVAPAPTPAAAPAKRDDELRFWIYEDKKGATHMVDALEKVPTEFRARAREMR